MVEQNDYVVILHGLFRTARAMNKMEKALTKEGYTAINITYPSDEQKIEILAEKHLGEIIKKKCPDKTKKINFVTHSLGGIIVRYYLAHHKIDNLGRVVAIAPPNQGSKYADILSKFEFVNFLAGPVLKQLKTEKNGLIHKIPEPYYEIGIIAGFFDSKVPPKNARLNKAKDFLITPHTHTFIMDASDVIDATIKFLKTGKF